LTTKDQQQKHSREPQKPTTPPQPPKESQTMRPDPGSNSWKLLIHEKPQRLLMEDARVHYVVLKQQPHTTHPTHQPPQKRGPTAHETTWQGNQKQTNPPTTRHSTNHDRPSTVLLPQDPTVCQTRNHPTPGPAVPGHTPQGGCIRTRQEPEPGSRYLLIFHP